MSIITLAGILQQQTSGGGGGGGITVSGTSTLVSTSGDTASVPKTPGLLDNDVVYVLLAIDLDQSVWTLSGWTEVTSVTSGGGRIGGFAVYRKVITDASSEPSTWDFVNSADAQSGVAIALTGVDNTTPEDTVTSINNFGNDTSPASEVFTPTVDDCMVLQFMAIISAANPDGIEDPISGHTLVASHTNATLTNNAWPCATVSYLAQTTAVATSGADHIPNNTIPSTMDGSTVAVAVAPA